MRRDGEHPGAVLRFGRRRKRRRPAPAPRSRELAAALPQIPDPASEDAERQFATFRETLLLWVTDPALNQALRTVGEALYDMLLEHSYAWPTAPGEPQSWDLRGALGDLRYLQLFLARIGGEPAECSALEPPEVALCAVAEAEPKILGEVGDRLERALESYARQGPEKR